ncbi:MAG: hypothetical protein WC460_01620 [Patescibacteria group bacterium]
MKSHYPQIKFVIDYKKDTENAIDFLKRRKGHPFIKWFLPQNFQYVLESSFSEKERNKILRAYTKFIFAVKKQEIVKGTQEARENWDKVKDRYFKLVDKIFYGRKWPKGKYLAIVTIYGMYPRDIKNKMFSFPFWHRLPKFSNSVIAHEMLHFMFFAYIKDRYGLIEGSKIKNKNPEYLWQVSEVFNDVIERWAPHYRIFKRGSKPYPGTQKMYDKMKADWKKSSDLNKLLDKWLK